MIPKEYSESKINPSELREECGIFGVYASKDIDTFSLAQFGMFALQHRGQEACGVSVLRDGNIHTYKQPGLVLDAFKAIEEVTHFQGNAAIGHTRYSTTGGSSRKNIQPMYAVNRYGKAYFSMVHNGNLTGCESIRKKLIKEGFPFLSTSDSEIMIRQIQKYSELPIQESIRKMMMKIKGAYSALLLTEDELAAFRDPHGVRPLCYGKIDENTWVFSSESCGLDAVGAKFIREIEPGEIVVIDKNNGFKSYQPKQKASKYSCAFEFIYFARPDSHIENKNIYEIRLKSGEKLYEQSPVKADIVIGVPDSGVPSAIGYARASGIPFEPVLVKNRYMSRSFIVPTQEMRERVVNLKLNPIASQIEGKRVVVLDDSIVRGTTSKRLVKILREAGAKEIHFRSASPPIVAPCFLGIDTPSKSQLISANMSIEELRKYMKVTSLDFLSINSLKKILQSSNHCFGCFTEQYPVKRE